MVETTWSTLVLRKGSFCVLIPSLLLHSVFHLCFSMACEAGWRCFPARWQAGWAPGEVPSPGKAALGYVLSSAQPGDGNNSASEKLPLLDHKHMQRNVTLHCILHQPAKMIYFSIFTHGLQ